MTMTQAPMISKSLLQRSILEDSFFDFVQYYWDVVVPEDPIWNWHIEYICNEMQTVAERVFDWKPKRHNLCLLYTSPSPRDLSTSRMPSSA